MNSDPEQKPIVDENDPLVDAAADALAESAEEVVLAEMTAEPAEDTVESLRKQLEEMEKTALRHQADMENFRKRSRLQMQDQLKYAALPLLTELLESADNLNRATESAADDQKDSSLVQGVTMVASQLTALLEKNGCQKIDSVGQPFDPNCHQAVQMQPSDEFPANIVMHEIRSGFKLHDRILRPAQVFVSTGPADSENA